MGIILISNEQKSGPFINIQYPSLLCDVEEIDPSELKRLYEEQKDNMVGPSYFETKLKDGVILAFFYTGFSLEHYVGKPGHAILVFISEDDIIHENLEGMMRRIAHELLPQSDETIFNGLFQDYYDLLKNGELGPYWEEVGEKQAIESNESTEINIIPSIVENKDQAQPTIDTNEIKTLKNHIWEQEEKLAHWREELANLNENNVNLMNKLKELKKESAIQKETIENQDEEILKLSQLHDQAQKIIEEMEQQLEENNELQKIAEKSNELIQEVQIKDEEILDLKEQLESMVKLKVEIDTKNINFNSIKTENKNLRSDIVHAEEEIKQLKIENERFLGTFTNLKLESKHLKEKLEGQNKSYEKLKDEIIDMKKEVKVLRREKDHYKNIVKEKNLL